MPNDDDIKRINFNISRELYDRFIEASQKEYTTTASVMTSWIIDYVKEKEKEQQNIEKKALQATLSILSKVLYSCSVKNQKRNIAILKEASNLLLELSTDPSLCVSIPFQAKIAKMERELSI